MLSSKESPAQNIVEWLRDAIMSEVSRIIDAEAKDAMTRVEAKVRGMTGSVCAKVLQSFRMEMRGSELVIRVEFGNPQKEES